jgi:hypothetical protein
MSLTAIVLLFPHHHLGQPFVWMERGVCDGNLTAGGHNGNETKLEVVEFLVARGIHVLAHIRALVGGKTRETNNQLRLCFSLPVPKTRQ